MAKTGILYKFYVTTGYSCRSRVTRRAVAFDKRGAAIKVLKADKRGDIKFISIDEGIPVSEARRQEHLNRSRANKLEAKRRREAKLMGKDPTKDNDGPHSGE